jgi:maltose-binding protein MalE
VQVRYDTSSPAAVLELARQSRTATAIPFDLRPVWESITTAGDPLNFRVLEGVLPASEGIPLLAAAIASQYGLANPELTSEELCPAVGPQALTLWHAWTEAETAALVEIVDEFEAFCPGITIELQAQDPSKQRERYTAAVRAGGGPDMQLESTQWSILLAQQGVLRDLTEEINQEWLEPLLPTAVAAMRYNQRLYGFPESVKSLGLYYNADLVEDPPLTLEDLLFQVDAEHRFAMPILYFYGYWGMTAFGGGLYDASGAVIPDKGGLEQWLAWLSEAKRRPGMLFTDSRRTAEEAFAAGQAAYFVSGPWSLANLQDQLGDKLRVAPLPAGPQGPGRPLLEVESVLFNPAISDGKLAAGLAFARYLTGKASQERLLATGQHISANIKVDLRDYPILQMFRFQANLAAVVYEGEEWLPIDAAGSAAYDEVLNQGREPVDAVADYNAVVKRYSGEK